LQRLRIDFVSSCSKALLHREIEVKETCIGNDDNVECPYCGKINHYVRQGPTVEVPDETTVPFEKQCFHCKKVVYYTAQRGKNIRDKKSPVFPATIIVAYAENPKQ